MKESHNLIMGASNSTPETVRIEEDGLAMKVAPSVVSRLVCENQAQNKLEYAKCKENEQIKHQTSTSRSAFETAKKLPQQWTPAQDLFTAKYNELEEYQFEKSIEKIKSMIGEPLPWLEDVKEAVTSLRYDLIKCYQDHPQQSLRCADKAKTYQNCIFREQYKIILKSTEQNKEDSGMPPTPTTSL